MEQTMVEYMEHIIVPYIDKVRESFGVKHQHW